MLQKSHLVILTLLFSTPTLAQEATSPATATVPMVGSYAVLVGGLLMVLAFFIRRLTTGWFHTQTGGLLILFVSTILTSCAEAVQRHGISKSVFVAAAGSACLTFVAMSNTKPEKNGLQPPDKK